MVAIALTHVRGEAVTNLASSTHHQLRQTGKTFDTVVTCQDDVSEVALVPGQIVGKEHAETVANLS